MTVDLILDEDFTPNLAGLENSSALDDTLSTFSEDIDEFRVRMNNVLLGILYVGTSYAA